jgi:N-acetylglucosaminyldiphosphoundecaprenol N-acetyl-beta-D-mannosaminyltransferase
VDALSLPGFLRQAENQIREGRFTHVLTVNPLLLALALSDADLAQIFLRADICVPESAGVLLIARLKNWPIRERIAGIDLMLELCALAAKNLWPVALLGGRPGVAETAVQYLTERFTDLKVAASYNGYLPPEEELRALEDLKIKKPKIVFVALGVPAQEKWISLNRNYLEGALTVGVGGSFDVLSGALKRAPLWMRQLDLEWLFRLCQEPWRIHRVLRTIKAVFLAIFRSIS